MSAFDTFALFARNELTHSGLRDAAVRRGLEVVLLGADPGSVVLAAGSGVAFRAPGGLIAQAQRLGTPIRLFGPTTEWFVSLAPSITGRSWSQVTASGAREMLLSGPVFIKLADAKRREVPARRYPTVAAFDAVMAPVRNAQELALLATPEWFDIDSEYRVFTRGRDVLTVSPYWVQDELWTPLLHTHRASFHIEAAQWVTDVLQALPDDDLPPAAVLDVARLVDGRLVLLEANQCWASGLYGCDPHAALDAVLAANTVGNDDRWRWRPDPAAAQAGNANVPPTRSAAGPTPVSPGAGPSPPGSGVATHPAQPRGRSGPP